MSDKSGVGERLQHARKASSLSQKVVAAAVLQPVEGTANEYRHQTISEWENETKGRLPSILDLTALCELYEVLPRWVLTGQGPQRAGNDADPEGRHEALEILDELRTKIGELRSRYREAPSNSGTASGPHYLGLLVALVRKRGLTPESLARTLAIVELDMASLVGTPQVSEAAYAEWRHVCVVLDLLGFNPPPATTGSESKSQAAGR